MTQTANSVLLYAALFLMAGTVVTLAVVILMLTWRQKSPNLSQNDAGQESESIQGSHANDVEDASLSVPPRQTPPPGSELTMRDAPPPKDKLDYRLVYEPLGRLARERRLKAATDRQNIRIALSGLASKGTYVFEDIVTDEGAIDFLTISRSAIHAIFVWTDDGFVWRDPSTKSNHVRGEDATRDRSGTPGYRGPCGATRCPRTRIFSPSRYSILTARRWM